MKLVYDDEHTAEFTGGKWSCPTLPELEEALEARRELVGTQDPLTVGRDAQETFGGELVDAPEPKQDDAKFVEDDPTMFSVEAPE